MEKTKKTKDELLSQIVELQKENASLKTIINSTKNESFDTQTKLILESAGEGILGINPNGDHTFVNPRAAKLLGYKPEELIGKNNHSVWHHSRPDGSYYPENECPIYETLHDGLKHFGEENFIKKDGTFIPVDFNSVPIIENEKITGAVVTFHNISKRKTIENSLKESEEKFRNIAEQLHAVLFTTDNKGIITFLSPSAYRIFGWKVDDMIGKFFTDFLHPAEIPKAIEKFKNAVAIGITSQNLILTMKHKDDNTFIGELSSTVLVKDDEIIGTIGLIHDITEQKKAELALKENESRFRSLFDSITESVALYEVVYDNNNKAIDCRTLFVNKAYEKQTGITREQAVGELVSKIYYGTSAPPYFDIFVSVAMGNESQSFETFFPPTNKFINISVSSPQKGQFVTVFEDITKRKHTEEILKESEEKYRAIFENIQDVYYETAIDGTILEISPSIKPFSKGQYTREELLGKPIQNFYYNDKERDALLSRLSKRGKVSDYEVILKNRDNSLQHGAITAHIEFDEDGKPVKIIGILRDITKRKEMDKSLKESEENLRALVENMGEGLGMVDENEIFVFANPATEKLFGVEPGELVGMNLSRFNTPEQFEIIKNQTVVRKQGKFSSYEHEIIRLNGEKRNIIVTASPRFDNLGQFVGTQAIFRDITEQKKVEKALTESASTLRGITETAQDAILMIDNNGNVSFWNPAAEKILGYSQSEAIGKNLHEVLAPEKYLDAHRGAFPEFQKTGKGNAVDKTLELQAIKKDGNEIEVELSLSALQIDNKWNAVGIIRDITQRKLAEKELAHTIAEKDKFFSIIAHDLKSPFSGFLGLTQLMSEQMQELSMKELQQYSKSLNDSATGLYKLLENLLEWSRMQRGLISFNPENISLYIMIDQNIGIIKEKAKQKEIEIQSSVSDGTDVFADVQMLDTVLRNLISNAVKFTNHGGTVQLSSEIIENDFVRISIKDSGVGIDKETLGKLFHVDKKVSRPGTDGESSTGLGLLLCKEFIEKNGGKIWVESEEDKGSTFHFTIPTTQT